MPPTHSDSPGCRDRAANAQIKTDFIASGNIVDIPDPAEPYKNNPDLAAWDDGRISICGPSSGSEYQDQQQFEFNEITSG